MNVIRIIGRILLFVAKLSLRICGFFFVFMLSIMFNSMRQIH